jgi:hypothetical protein
MSSRLTRRRFVAKCSAAIAALLIARRAAWAQPIPLHPTPRPGITGANVLTRKALAETPKLIPVFDSVREIPQIVDGIRCNCGCTDPPTFYSLLSCFEAKGMARTCVICQSQARLVARLHKEGKSLDQIRVAVDAKFS